MENRSGKFAAHLTRHKLRLPECSLLSTPMSVGAGFEAGDFGHDFVGDLLVNFLEALFGTVGGFGAQRLEPHGLAILDGETAGTGQTMVRAKGVARAEYAGGDDGRAGFDDCQSYAGTGGVQIAVPAAGAFWK